MGQNYMQLPSGEVVEEPDWGRPANSGATDTIPVLELGKARAKEAFLAGSGRVINPSRFSDTRQVRYRMGRHRGKTPDQVDEEFQGLWEKASPAIRAKYAKMAESQSAEAPKGNAELNAALPGESMAEMYERQRRSRIEMYGGKKALDAYDANREASATRVRWRDLFEPGSSKIAHGPPR